MVNPPSRAISMSLIPIIFSSKHKYFLFSLLCDEYAVMTPMHILKEKKHCPIAADQTSAPLNNSLNDQSPK